MFAIKKVIIWGLFNFCVKPTVYKIYDITNFKDCHSENLQNKFFVLGIPVKFYVNKCIYQKWT